MNKTIAYLMLAFIITSSFSLSSCKDKKPPVEENIEMDANGGNNPSDENSPKTDSQPTDTDTSVNSPESEITNTNTTEQSEQNTDTTQTNTSDQNSQSSNTDNSSTETVSEYKNGTYSYNGSYNSPAGSETVGVTFVIDNDTVSSVTINPLATNQTSQYYQKQFAAGISAVVVGKKIDELSVGKVNGASLTPNGFNQALASLKSGAKN